MDSTAVYISIHFDYYSRTLQIINAMQQSRAKGSLTLYFDGSGRIARITKTEDIK